jgi:alkaline phosphatase
MNGDRTTPLKTIAEEARDNGFKVGIISSVSIDHATPASFYAHQPKRNMYYQISLELAKSGFDFFGGGSFADPFYKNSDTVSVFSLAPQMGYTITTTKKDFYDLRPTSGKVIATGTNIESSGALRYAIDQDDEDIPLEDFVEKGIELLDNEKGFFIMCEEGKIDWASHGNDGATVIYNVLSLSKAVEKAVGFYKKHPDETLIVVTADHETGGFALGWAGTHYESDLKLLELQKISSSYFTKIADSLMTIPENQNYDFMMSLVEEYFGLGGETGLPLSPTELKMFSEAYAALSGTSTKSAEELGIDYGGYHEIAVTATRILNNRAGLSWGTWSHTAIPVPVFAIGTGQEMFNGYYDNTDIPKKIAKIMGFWEME